jgi:hypothetical protein
MPILVSGVWEEGLMAGKYPRPCNICQGKYCFSNEILHRGKAAALMRTKRFQATPEMPVAV